MEGGYIPELSHVAESVSECRVRSSGRHACLVCNSIHCLSQSARCHMDKRNAHTAAPFASVTGLGEARNPSGVCLPRKRKPTSGLPNSSSGRRGPVPPKPSPLVRGSWGADTLASGSERSEDFRRFSVRFTDFLSGFSVRLTRSEKDVKASCASKHEADEHTLRLSGSVLRTLLF
jgi:hypothetical protein